MKNQRIEGAGLEQCTNTENTDSCDVCDRPLRGREIWWRTTGYFERETDTYCRRCASDYVKTTEAGCEAQLAAYEAEIQAEQQAEWNRIRQL